MIVPPTRVRRRYLFKLADYLRSVNGLDDHIALLETQVQRRQRRPPPQEQWRGEEEEEEAELVVMVGSKNPVKLEATRLGTLYL